MRRSRKRSMICSVLLLLLEVFIFMFLSLLLCKEEALVNEGGQVGLCHGDLVRSSCAAVASISSNRVMFLNGNVSFFCEGYLCGRYAALWCEVNDVRT